MKSRQQIPNDQQSGPIVSFDNEALIIVDAQDRILGHGNKADLHRGSGTLHRAFSIFLFNSAGELLLTRRSNTKPLWPGFWSNTCCSHPRRGETYGVATQRRLREELGIETPLLFTHVSATRLNLTRTALSTSCALYMSAVWSLRPPLTHWKSVTANGSAPKHLTKNLRQTPMR